MGQLGFFDVDKRLEVLSARGDPLEAIDHLVPWESFRTAIEAVVLTPDELKKRVNHAKSRIRARIEHVFGAQQNAPGGRIVRTIGIMRARAKIGLQNLAYNIRRLVTLERLAAA